MPLANQFDVGQIRYEDPSGSGAVHAGEMGVVTALVEVPGVGMIATVDPSVIGKPGAAFQIRLNYVAMVAPASPEAPVS